MKKDGRRWVEVATVPTSNFSGELVKQVLLPSARRGELYRVQATGENGRFLNSPDITIKKETIADLDIVRVEPLTGGSVRLSWADEKRSDTMIYFLVVEEKDGDTLAEIYTRKNTGNIRSPGPPLFPLVPRILHLFICRWSTRRSWLSSTSTAGLALWTVKPSHTQRSNNTILLVSRIRCS